jgi:DNA-binding MarR family transcriptional regulator
MYSLNESLPFLLNRAGLGVAAAFSLELKELNLTLPMWRVLAAIWGNGDQRLNGLGALTCVDISTLSRQVAAMEKKGLLSRTQSGIDWRSINIALTQQGRAMVEQLLPIVERHERAALADISIADVRRLKLLLNQVFVNISALDHAETIGLG